jgi:hypothetical protein
LVAADLALATTASSCDDAAAGTEAFVPPVSLVLIGFLLFAITRKAGEAAVLGGDTVFGAAPAGKAAGSASATVVFS